jgi:2-polyprenyl-3-methyl-5-hydroxy-6-metoxy-1,4-benzoquinol methylase
VKRIEKNKMCDDQTINYPDQDIKPLIPDEVDASKTKLFRFMWTSGNIDNMLKSGLICQNYLDIGACDGYMAVLVAKKKNINGFPIHVDAVEAHKQSYEVIVGTAKNATNAGLDIAVYNTLFEDYTTGTMYDIITAFEIIEHSKDPIAFLEKIHSLLKIGGSLTISAPEEHGRYGIGDDNPYHYWAFTIQSLSQMFDDARWRIFQIMEVGDLIHLIAQKVK